MVWAGGPDEVCERFPLQDCQGTKLGSVGELVGVGNVFGELEVTKESLRANDNG